MAGANNKTAMFLNMVLMLSLLLIISVAESRNLGAIGFPKPTATPHCDTVYGVASGDTCFSILQTFKLTAEFFDSINPNLNCDAMFVGQWLCVAGAVN